MAGQSIPFDRIATRIPASAFASEEPPAQALVITCVDGCLPEGCLESQLRMDGLIVVRNPANLVPCCGSEGMAETVSQALARGVGEVIVCGHADCSAIARMLDPHLVLTDLELAAWLDHAEAIRLAVRGLPPAEQFARAIEWNITQQLTHLRAYPTIAAALLSGRLRVHGWLHHHQRDEMLAADPHTGQFTRRAALDPTQNRLFRKERLRAGPLLPLPQRDLRSRYLA